MSIYKKKIVIERLVLIGPMKDRNKWLDWCYDNGYAVIRSGPKPLSLGYVSHAKFKIVAEKEIKK